MELIDTKMSGNCWKVRLLAGWCGIPLKRRTLSIQEGDTKKDWFGAISPLRQVPVLKTREGEWLAESAAILWYLAEGTPFLPDDAVGRGQVLQWLLFEQTRLMRSLAQPRVQITLMRTMDRDDPRAQRWRERGYEAFKVLETQLGRHAFVASDRPSIADAALYPYIRMAGQGGYDLAGYPNMGRWLQAVRALPGYVPLFEGDPATA